MGEKGGKNLNQISEKDQLITWKEKCSHTEAVPPLLFSRAMETPDEIICKRVKLPQTQTPYSCKKHQKLKSPKTVYNFIRKQEAPQLGLCPQYA